MIRMARKALSPELGGTKGFALAAALAILAAILVFAVLRSSSGDSAASTAATVPVVTAAGNIAAGVEITPEMLRVTQVPQNVALANGFTATEQVVGQYSRIPLVEGEQLVGAKLAAVGTDATGLTYTVPEGYRAMAVKITEVIGAGGLLRPGDRVDLLAAVRTGVGEDRAITLAQNVEVLAVEQAIVNVTASGGTLRATDDGTLVDQPEADPEGKVATLALTLSQAQQVLLAEAQCEIRLAVRPPGDTSIVELENSSFTSIAFGIDPAAETSDTPLAVVVPEGQRAFAVTVGHPVVAAGGLLQPGDRVDVLGTITVEVIDAFGESLFEEARAFTVAQNLEVLAIQQRIIGDPDQPLSGDTGGAVDQPSTQFGAIVVTLAVTPEQAQQILLTEVHGVIRLSLRGPGEDEVLTLDDSAFAVGEDGTGFEQGGFTPPVPTLPSTNQDDG